MNDQITVDIDYAGKVDLTVFNLAIVYNYNDSQIKRF